MLQAMRTCVYYSNTEINSCAEEKGIILLENDEYNDVI